jgi:hypothetical protein
MKNLFAILLLALVSLPAFADVNLMDVSTPTKLLKPGRYILTYQRRGGCYDAEVNLIQNYTSRGGYVLVVGRNVNQDIHPEICKLGSVEIAQTLLTIQAPTTVVIKQNVTKGDPRTMNLTPFTLVSAEVVTSTAPALVR